MGRMRDLLESLSQTTPQDLMERIASLEGAWGLLSPSDRRYWMVDAAMRLGWLAGRSRTASDEEIVARLTTAFRNLEKRR